MAVVEEWDARPPHLMYILADDFGWADADWHRPADWPEAATPNMLKLVRSGVELDNMHAFKFCSRVVNFFDVTIHVYFFQTVFI